MNLLRRIIEDPRTERVIMTLIVINAVTLGRETSQTVMERIGTTLHVLDQLILAATRLLSPGVERRILDRHSAVARACQLIEREPGASWTVERLARASGSSASHLAALFVRDLGVGPRRVDVDRGDAGVGMRAAQDRGGQHDRRGHAPSCVALELDEDAVSLGDPAHHGSVGTAEDHPVRPT